jgi:prepilin-type N-terminal cleavage/methylation domain-containing protein
MNRNGFTREPEGHELQSMDKRLGPSGSGFRPTAKFYARGFSPWGFTIIEIIVVLIILGMLAAFAVPKFSKSLDKADAKEAQSALSMMYEASRVYGLRHGGIAAIDGLADVNAINGTLDIHIVKANVAYSCGHDGTGIFCGGTSTTGTLTMYLDGASAGTTVCTGTLCP